MGSKTPWWLTATVYQGEPEPGVWHEHQTAAGPPPTFHTHLLHCLYQAPWFLLKVLHLDPDSSICSPFIHSFSLQIIIQELLFSRPCRLNGLKTLGLVDTLSKWLLSLLTCNNVNELPWRAVSPPVCHSTHHHTGYHHAWIHSRQPSLGNWVRPRCLVFVEVFPRFPLPWYAWVSTEGRVEMFVKTVGAPKEDPLLLETVSTTDIQWE